MTDQELIERLEDGTLSHEGFHHREHVRAAFLFLTKYPVLEALQAFSKALRRLAENRGKPQAYHETITWAYVLLIQERMKRDGKNQGWEEFADNNPDLLAWKDGILTRYYRPRPWHPIWREAIFVLPDLRASGR